MSKRRRVEIWFEDEARIGQKNGQVRQWARRGTRPRQPADQRYDNAYLFGAICPARGVGGVGFGFVHQHRELRQLGAQLVGDLAPTARRPERRRWR